MENLFRHFSRLPRVRVLYKKKEYLCAPKVKTDLHTDKRRLLGYVAGILAGVSYGTNPLFGKALMESGVPILVMLFFRYGISGATLSG